MRTALIAGVVDTLITLGALLAARSSVLVADFLKTALEACAVLLAWLAIRRITKGSNEQFEYGLGKLENLSSLAVGTTMIVVFLIISTNAVLSIMSPSHIHGIGVWISLVAQVVYGAVNGFFCLRCRREAKRATSPIMESQAQMFFTKSFGNVFIFVSLVSSMALSDYEWSVYIDPFASLVIAGTILIAAIGVFTSSFSDLLDKTLEETDQIAILRELAKHFERYEELHGIRSRRAGGRVFIEVFLGFDPDKKVKDVQGDVNAMRASIEQAIAGSSVVIALADGSEH